MAGDATGPAAADDGRAALERLGRLEEENARLRRERDAARGDAALGRAILASATGHAIVTTDGAGRITSWNPGARDLVGWEDAEAVGEGCGLIFTPEDRAAGVPEAEMARAAADGWAEDERWLARKDGTRFWASGLLLPLREGGAGFVKIFQDRTAERRATEALRGTERRLLGLARASPRIASAPGLAGTLREVTEAARAILGAHLALTSLTRGPAGWAQAIQAVSLSDEYAPWRGYADRASPDGSGVYAEVCRTNRPMRTTQAELVAHPLWRGFGRHAAEHPPLRGWLCAPLVARDGRNLGLIQLSDKLDGGEFDEADEAVLVELARLAAAAVEQERTDAALRASEERFRQFAEASDDVLWIIDADRLRLEYLSPAFEAVWGESRDAVRADLGRWAALVHPDDRERASAGLPAALRGERREQEYRIVRASDGAVRWIRDKAFPIMGPDGRVRRVTGLARDITARKEADQRQALLLHELAHRVKNTLATILAITQQTGLRAADLEGFLDAFEGRVRALAAAHDLLSDSGWRGTPLAALARAALAPHEEEPGDGRFRVDVADGVTLTPAAAQTLVLALHELATNAIRHGALSAPGGRVELEGRVEGGGELVLAWREAGGPPVAPPAGQGFGMALLERVVVHQHDGRVELDWRLDGLACTLQLPLARVAEPAGAPPR